jgi:hypothetical protein
MTDANEVKWTLWVFAGPGAFSDKVKVGQLLPLADVVDELPAGVARLAETVGAPTLLQQLTGEWPAQRLALGLAVDDVPRAERDLCRFLAWAEAQTPKGSKRALIVLGDLLQAIGEEPKAVVAGVYRPNFPTTILVRKKNDTNWNETFTKTTKTDAGSTNDADNPWYRLSADSNNWQAFSALTDLLADDKFINFSDSTSVWYLKSTSGNWFSKGTSTQAGTFTASTTDTSNYTITRSGNGQYSITVKSGRSLDDAGLPQIDLATRRIDALLTALEGRQVDLLASGRDLAQLAALRRLASRKTVLLATRESHPSAAQPLLALLGALRSEVDLVPEQLAEQTGLVALRCSGAEQLLGALDEFASQALAGSDSPAMRCFTAAWDSGNGGDLARLIKQLERIDSNQANKIESYAAAMIIGPVTGKAASLGIELGARGLQLGASSDWTRLLENASAYANADMMRCTLQDLQALTTSARWARRPASTGPAQAGCVLEYAGPARANADATPTRDFERFLRCELGQCDARHVALVIRGKWAPAYPGSVMFDTGAFLPIATLTRCLRDALSRRGSGPLALIIFEDAELLRVENAYELREVAYVLLTAVAGSQALSSQWLTKQMLDVIARCEQRAARALDKSTTGSIAPIVQTWRRDVAVRLAKLLVAPGPNDTGPVALQGIDLRHINAMCRLFDRLCHRMLDNLDDASVLTAARAGDGADSLIEWINRVQMQGFYPQLQQASPIACDLHNHLGDLYNWISQLAVAVREVGAPLWIAPNFTEDRDPAGYCSRLRISVGPHQPKDYRTLSFHQDVSLHALLTATRLLGNGDARERWGLISMGLAYGSNSQRHKQLERLIQEPNAAHYFSTLGTPPLLSLSIDKDQSGTGYELRMKSSESQAALIRRRSVVDLTVAERSLEGLAYVMSRSMASRAGFEYLEGLGASLSEDVVNKLRSQLERERGRMLKTGRCREAHLALELPRELMRYPWELMQLPASVSGGRLEMLAERFAVGRQMWTDRDVRRKARHDGIRMLIVADPNTPLGGELPAARKEGIRIQQVCAQTSQDLDGAFEFVCDASISETLTRTVLRQRLRSGNYDVLHFAGHGKFDEQQPDHSGWALSDGLLTVTELSNTLASCEAPPWLIYANACSVGMISAAPPRQYHGDVHGMADACIRAGVSAYVAPLWSIHDESALLLASEFYRRLLLERSTIGVALQHARLQVRKTWEALRGDAGLGDISWAGMVLFGNPGVRLMDGAS